MSTLASAALVLVCIWLGVLTLVVVLLVRQIGLLTVRLSVAGEAASSVDDDGPEVGSSVPEEVVSVLPDQEEDEQAYLLLISANCTPCRELVADLDGRHFEQQIVALVPGHEEMASELAALLPSSMQVVLDPEAVRLAEALDLESTPFVLEVQSGTVTRKAYLDEGASDLIDFVESGGARAETKSFAEITEKETSEGR
jgi:hypothetical protein